MRHNATFLLFRLTYLNNYIIFLKTMKKMKKLLIIFVSLGFLLVVGANIYAEWIYCSTFFSGDCSYGGCRDAQGAGNCQLFNCDNIPGFTIMCVKPVEY